jgi:uncharacterized protein YndB with AHSA1/START domain
MASFRLEKQVAAAPETIFEVMTDHRGYAKMTMLRRSELEREGEPAPNGLGAIRKLSAAGPPLREEVIAYEPPSRFSYTLLSGLPVRDHVGTISLEPRDGGTKVVYTVRTIPTVPLAGFVVVAAVKFGVRQLLSGIVRESERRAAANG